MVDVNGTVYHLRIDMCTMGKRLMLFCMAPQWGSNSKGYAEGEEEGLYWCFSPRNGEVILKSLIRSAIISPHSFSPRNGEVILKKSS